jgi:lambda family phage minor tail protein L
MAEATINLYQFDLNPLGINLVYYYHGEEGGAVTFNGNVYNPIPIRVEGFETAVGVSPEPKVLIGNTDGIVSAFLRQYSNFRAAKITRLQTKPQYLGLPTNPNYVLGYPQVFRVNRPSNVNGISVALELQSIFELQRVQIPGRKFYRDRCPWTFRDGNCGYTGSGFSTCPNTLGGCKQRFGANSVLPFGGFPTIDLIKTN